MTENNPQAFPRAATDGMTLRDYFAGQAVIGYTTSPRFAKDEEIAKWCYALADALVKERNKNG